MQELRFVAVSEDGGYAVLAVPGRSARFTLPIDERLRAVALGQTSRLVQYEIEVENPLRPKEIQARIRAGETVEEIADAAGIAVERVRWFEGPVLAERAYMADQAQRASVRRQGDSAPSTPGPRLGEIVTERLQASGSDPEDAQWDAKKRGDGSWQVQLAFVSSGRLHEAEWVFDPRRRHVLPVDDNAARMSLPGGELPKPAEPAPGEATVTQLAPRLSTAAGQGFGQSGTGTSGFAPVGAGHSGAGNGGSGNGGAGNGGAGNGGRARHERPGPSRPPVSEPASPAPTPPAPTPPPPTPEVPAAVASETSDDDLRPSAAGRHSPAQPVAPEPSRPAKAPTTEPPAATASHPVTPATVAAQVSKAGRASQPGGTPQPTPAPESAQAARASEPEADEPRPETTVPAARPGSTVPVAAAASPAKGAKPESAAPAEPGSEQAGRQSRKSARGKRASVPSWDEIMFGSARQRD